VSVIQAIILGAVQGLTEFIPISSSGHLVLAKTLLGVELPGITFEVMVHLGTLLAVLLYFGRDIGQVIRAFFTELTRKRRRQKGIWGNADSRLGMLVVIGTIPAVVIGLLIKDWVETAFSSPVLVGAMLIVTGVVLWSSDRGRRGKRNKSDLRIGDALSIGLMQAFAILPGISRSGFTISAGLRRRIDRPLAARYSFLLSIPAIAGAGFIDLIEVVKTRPELPWSAFIAGTVTAFVTGLMAIRLVMVMVSAGRFRYFAVYTWIVGAFVLIQQLMRFLGV